MTSRRRSTRSAFTIIEMTIALVLVTVVVGNVYWLLQKSTVAMGDEGSSYDLDTQARRAMDRICMALIGAANNELYVPTSKPSYTSYLNYKESLGLDASGNNQLSDLQRIEFTTTNGGEVVWSQNPGATDEKRVVFAKNVATLLQDELTNGVDDNANGIIDETGFALEKNGKSIIVRLTIRRTLQDGRTLSRTLAETVTCRN